MASESEKEVKKEKRGFGAWLANFWYYYKWHTLVAIVLIAGICVGVSSCANRQKMDLCIYYFSQDPLAYNEDNLNLYNALLPYVSDFTGDGQVRLEVQNYYMSASNVEDQMNQFRTELQGGAALLILMDRPGMEQMIQTPYLGDLSDVAPQTQADGRIWDTAGSAFRARPELEHWSGELFFGMHVFEDNTMIRVIPGKEEEFAYAKSVLENIINDRVVNPQEERQ